MGHFMHVATVGASGLAHPWGISVLDVVWFQDTPYLYAGAFADGGVNRLRLASDQVAEFLDARPASNQSGSRGLTDMVFLDHGDQSLWLAAGRHQASRAFREVDADGSLRRLREIGTDAGDLAQWTHLATFTGEGAEHVVAARWGAPGVQVFRVDSPTSLTLTDVQAAGTKTALGDVSALLTLHPGPVPVVIAGSAAEGGIASYLAHADGRLELADTLGARFGLGIAGVTALAGAEVMGESFVLVGASGTGTISSFRVNHLGVLFEADHVTDTLHTRFGGVQDIATFSHEGRAFAVAGGGDDGLALFELGPGGRLYHLQSITHQPGWTLENVQAVAAAVVGGSAQVFAAGEVQAGLTQFTIDLDRFGISAVAQPGQAELSGTGRDDHLEAGAGDVTLRGQDGNDRLVAGPGLTTMWGGPGADVFVFRPGGGTDRIMDFRPGEDRIDLSAYPMLYTPQALTITPTDSGARIFLRGDLIDVQSHDFTPLSATDFGADSFIFG